MKIEIDTRTDSKEDLRHLAEMLHRLSGSSGAVVSKPSSGNIFDDPSPAGGLMGMFGDTGASSSQESSPQVSSSSTMSSPEPSAPSGGLFSIFGSSDAPAQSPSAGSELTASQLLSGEIVDRPKEEGQTSAKDLLDDDRIVPY